MRLGSILIFAIALGCSGAAALLVRSALMAPASEPASAKVQTAAVAMKTILVAVHDIKAGDRLTAAMVRDTAWPADMLPKGSFTSREALFQGGIEPLLYTGIAENEPILAQRLIGGVDYGLAGRLNDGMRAVTIRVNESSSVGGFVQAEDRVDVLLTQTDKAPENSTGPAHTYTKTLIRNVRVLAADQQTQRKVQNQPPKTVTLEVSEDDAKRLTLAGTVGQLSLTLNKGENSLSDGRTIDLRDIAGIWDERKSEKPGAGTAGPVVAVFRSVERKEYRVPRE